MHTLVRGFPLVAAIACLPACAEREARPNPAPVERVDGAEAIQRADAISLEGWKSETFPLPPAFAPDLPTGTESLRFAPGWRDPKAAGFWSYAFVMWIDEPAPDAARIRDLLEKYYNGLMASFAADKNKDITPARVEVSRAGPNRYEARMHLIDAFATFEPIDLRVLIEVAAQSTPRPDSPTTSVVRIQVSPQATDHAIWRSLGAAVASIPAPEAVVDRPH